MCELSVYLVIHAGFIQSWHGFALLMGIAKLARAHYNIFLICAMIMSCSIAVCMASGELSCTTVAWHCEDVLDGFFAVWWMTVSKVSHQLQGQCLHQHHATSLADQAAVCKLCCENRTSLLLSPEAAAVVILQLLLFVKGNSVLWRLLFWRDSFLVHCRQQMTRTLNVCIYGWTDGFERIY